jgi:hypothetical protein
MQDTNVAPNLTQDDLNAIQQAQQQAQTNIPPQEPQTQDPFVAPQMQSGVDVQPQQPVQAGQPTPDELEMAKKLLGIEEIQRQAMEAQQKLKELEMERTKEQVMKKYPNVPIDLVEQEIAKVEKTNPQLAEAMKLNPDLMEMAVKAVLASVKPQEQPDKITQGTGTDTNPDDELTEIVKKGQADEIALGDYILNLSKGQ